MMKHRIYRTAGLLAVVLLLLPGCRKQQKDEWSGLDDATREQRQYVNMFAYNMMNTYYLWKDSVQDQLNQWAMYEDPIAKVASLRYKDAAGKDIDRWTVLTDDFSSFEGAVSGFTKTFGMDFSLYYADASDTRIVGVVTFTYADSPAEKAGLQRGDVFQTVDGQEMTPDNYVDILSRSLYGGGTLRLGLEDGRTVSMAAVDMYENPVQKACVLDWNGKKVGYLHYTSFTLASCPDLIRVFRDFTEAGIDELVLDLRYNGGGYVIAEELLASLLAPRSVVSAGAILSRQIYNSDLAGLIKEEDAISYFRTDFSYTYEGKTQTLSTEGANPDLERLYVLVSGNSASASESLVCDLMPYMEVNLLGEQTNGKYCAGLLLGATEWYDSVKSKLEAGLYEKARPLVDNWGIYVMYARYANCNGETASMPDGIPVGFRVKDNPLDGHLLGDPEETLLAAALARVDGTKAPAVRSASGDAALQPVPDAPRRKGSGLLVGSLPR